MLSGGLISRVKVEELLISPDRCPIEGRENVRGEHKLPEVQNFPVFWESVLAFSHGSASGPA